MNFYIRSGTAGIYIKIAPGICHCSGKLCPAVSISSTAIQNGNISKKTVVSIHISVAVYLGLDSGAAAGNIHISVAVYLGSDSGAAAGNIHISVAVYLGSDSGAAAGNIHISVAVYSIIITPTAIRYSHASP